MTKASTGLPGSDDGYRRGESILYYRLVALWVLNEALLGGIIHGLKIPVSGIVVGSCAVICICLIGWYVPRKGAILKATITVAIFKMMLSPQAPPPAYIAVFFQGLLGELLFWKRRFYALSCFLLAVLALLESGLQRILVLTIIYGNDFWKVINDFINGLTRQKNAANYSLIIGSAYVTLHVLTGVVAGWIAAVLPRKAQRWSADQQYRLQVGVKQAPAIQAPLKTKKRRRIKKGLLVTWIVLTGLYIQSYYQLGDPLLPAHASIKILLRSVIIVSAWIFIVGPATRALLHFWLRKKRASSQPDIEAVFRLLPSTRALVADSWKRSGGKGISRLRNTFKSILVNLGRTGREFPDRAVYIFSWPVQSGKTSSLIEWAQNSRDLFGVLTPVVEGKRMFMDAHTRERFDMEAGESEKDPLLVGRYRFSRHAFARAIDIIQKARNERGWLVIDEIGPMELRGEGFADILKENLSGENPHQRLLLVVRSALVNEVITQFGIYDAIVIQDLAELPGMAEGQHVSEISRGSL